MTRDPRTDVDAALDRAASLARGVAYRLLGSVQAADDVARLTAASLPSGATDGAPDDFTPLTIATRIAIDRDARDRARRYRTWLPEPVLDEPGGQPWRELELGPTPTLRHLRELQALLPTERAAAVLHDTRSLDAAQIDTMLDRDPGRGGASPNTLLAAHHPRGADDRSLAIGVAHAFTEALVQQRPVEAQRLVHPHGQLAIDRGPARRDVEGVRGRVAIVSRLSAILDGYTQLELASVNGLPGVLGLDAEGWVVGAIALEATHAAVTEIDVVAEPDKLDAASLQLRRIRAARAMRP